MKTKENDYDNKIHQNHRQRLQKLIYNSELKNLSEIQILEYILTLFIPRKDTNPLAHKLLDEFGNISDVFEANFDRLISVKGVGHSTATKIKSLCKIFHFTIEQTKTNKVQKLLTPSQIIDFFKTFLNKKTCEEFYMASLNAKSEIIKVDKIADGNVNKVSIDLRKISEIAIKNNASIVIIAHNHPEGEPQPSIEDISATAKIFSALSVLGIGLLDHIIISNDSYFSFHTYGLLEHLTETEQIKQNKLSNKIYSYVVDNSSIEFEKQLKRSNIYNYPQNDLNNR